VPWGHEFDFLSRQSVFPLDWQTLEFIGPLYWSLFFGSKRFVDYLWVLLAAAGIVLIAPWTNNGINV
jgi:threonine/homoserine efflux transporter RhtA